MRLVNWRGLVLAAAGFGLAACGDDVTVTPTPISFSTNPTAVSCVAGTQTAAGISVAGGTGTPTVTFTASGSGFTVAQSGNSVTITCSAAGAGAVNFTITSGNQTVTGSIPVTVTAAPNPTGVTAVAVNPQSASLVPGGTTTLTATVTLAQGAPASTSTAVTWTTSDATIATVTTNANGTATVTAVNSAANVGKQAVITATSVANTNLKASTTITVAPTSTIIQGLQVSPTAVSLIIGGTQGITSNVTLAAGAPAGTSTNVTCTSSNTAIATVSGGNGTPCTITATGNGTATITVASVAAPSVSQQIAVTVTPQAPVRLTVQSLQTVTAAGQVIPVDQTNAFGRITATLNLDPGSFTPDSVVATLGTQRVNCQTFTAQLAATLKQALTTGSADFAPIQCQLNTSAFDTTTGTPRVLNGAQTFNATVYYRPTAGSPASTTQTATIPIQLTINNTNGVFVKVSNTPTATQVANGAPASGQAVGPQGILWRAGTISVTVLPVNFTTGAFAGTTVTLTDANLPGGTVSATVPVAGGTATFAGASAASTASATAASPLNGLTSQTTGTVVSVPAAIQILTAAGNPVTANTTGAPAGGQMVPTTSAAVPSGLIWIDNQNPPIPSGLTFPASFLAQGGTGYINGAFTFSDSVTVNNLGTPTTGGTVANDNNGVDVVKIIYQFANAPLSGTSTFTTVATGADVNAAAIAAGTSGVTAAGTQVSTAFAVRAAATDALGNRSLQANGTAVTFGTDLAAPGQPATVAGTATALAQINTPSANIILTGLSDPQSGLPVRPLLTTISRLQIVAGAAKTTCPDTAGGDFVQTNASTTGGCTRASGVLTPTGSTASANVNFTGDGYYTVSMTLRDRADNMAAVTQVQSRQFVIDAVGPGVVAANGFAFPGPVTRGTALTLSPFTFSDNLDIINTYLIENYGAIALLANTQQIHAPFSGTLVTSATPAFTFQINATATSFAGASSALATLNGAVQDAGRNVNNSGQFVVPFGNITPGAASSANPFGTATSANLTFAYATGAITQLSVGGNTNTTTGSSAAVTLTMQGPSTTFSQPFATIELRAFDAALGAYRVVGSLSLANTLDNGTVRTYTYTGTFAPTTSTFTQATNGGGTNLIAVAYAANGDAYYTAATANIPLVP